MHILNRILKIYIDSSIHVALAVLALTWVSCIQFNLRDTSPLLFCVFCVTIVGYNFTKYVTKINQLKRQRPNFYEFVRWVTFMSLGISVWLMQQLQLKTVVVIGCLGLINGLYTIPFFKRSFKSLRQIPRLKIYVIAFVWVGVTVFVPVIEYNYPLNFDVLITAIQRFLIVLILMIPFEIRDLKYDDLHLKTLPQLLGVNTTKILGIVLLFVCLGLEFFKDEVTAYQILAYISVALITGGFVAMAKTEQSYVYSSFWVEAIPVLWLAVLFMLC